MGEFSSIIATEFKLVLLAAWQASQSRDRLLKQGIATQPADWEDGRQEFQRTFFPRVRVQASFIRKLKVLVAPSYPIVCHPMDCSPPACSVHRILQARILEWFAIPFSRGSSQPRDQTQVSHFAGGFFYQRSHQGSPRRLEWVACPFSSRSSRTRVLLHCRQILYQLSYQGSPDRKSTRLNSSHVF